MGRVKGGSDKKTGPDGLTKQQRYFMRNREKINARNAERNRKRRLEKKLEKTEKNPTPDKCKASAPAMAELNGADAVESSAEDDDDILKCKCGDDSIPMDEHKCIYSTWFDQQLDKDLAALEKLDAQMAAIDRGTELRLEYDALRKRVTTLITFISERWNFREGWHFKRAYEGSRTADRMVACISQTRGLIRNLVSLLHTYPTDEDSFQGIIGMLHQASGAEGFMWQLHNSLTEDATLSDGDIFE